MNPDDHRHLTRNTTYKLKTRPQTQDKTVQTILAERRKKVSAAEIIKMGGGMEANKNKFIEEWGAARENLEHNFRWTRRNFALVGFFGIALPIFVYKGIVKEFNMQDEDAGRPYRKFL